ncbi:hypothetical protein FI667_g8513, partial [Globisporangium splendens]
MVRKASRLPPHTKSLEEVLLHRIVNGRTATQDESDAPSSTRAGGSTQRSTSSQYPTTAAPSRRQSTTTAFSTTPDQIPLAAGPDPARGGDERRSSSAVAAGAASMECMTQIAGEMAVLDKRMRSLATRQSAAASTVAGAAPSKSREATREGEASVHQQAIDQYLQESMVEIYKAHSSASKKNANAGAVNPTAGARMTHAVRGIRSTVRRLDRVFYEVASGDKQRQLAATKIATMCRSFVVRRRFDRFQRALAAWRTRKCSQFLVYLERFSAREEFINRQIAAMQDERTDALLRGVLAEIRDVVLMNLPLRMRRLEETERRFQLLQRNLIKGVFLAWKLMGLGSRSRKNVATDSKKRHAEARQRLEALERFELITTEMVHEEFLKENIRVIRSKHSSHMLRMYFQLLYTLKYAPMKLKWTRTIAHDRKACIVKIWCEWLPMFRAAQVDKAIAGVTERRTLHRFDKHHNLRKTDAHYRRTNLLKHLRAWATYGQRIRRVRKLFEDNTKENLVRLMHKWHVRAQYQHALRDNVIEEWRAYSRRIFQTPFRCWYVYASQKRAHRITKETICVAYERRQRRHIKYNFFRLWKHQVLFGNVEGVHSKLHLLRSLEDQKRMCLGLEANARLYQENIAALHASIAQLETKLEEKQLELAQVHDSTQVIRFGLHNAEQNIVRVQGMLEAMRNIHPGTVKRIEKMYNDNPLLSNDLKVVLELHACKRKELLDKIDVDETELDVHNAASPGTKSSGKLHEDDQLLLHRVKWVLSRLDLHCKDAADGSVASPSTTTRTAASKSTAMHSMNQLCALFEFIRDGDTSVLTPDNDPSLGDRYRRLLRPSSTAASTMEIVHRSDLLDETDTWRAFVQALTIQFVPERMLSVKERLVKRATQMDDEIAQIKANPHVYNVYRYAKE